MIVISLHRPWRPEEHGTFFFKCSKKRSVNPKYYTQGIYYAEMKGESRHSQKEKWENLSPADLSRMTKVSFSTERK